MFELKFVLRSFKKKGFVSFLLILGAIIPALLTVSSLSLNDSITSYRAFQLKENFGEADSYIMNSRSSLFFSFPLSEFLLNDLKENRLIKNILPVSESMGRIEKDGAFLETLVIATNKDDISNFTGKEINLTPGNAVISEKIALDLGLKEGDTIILHMPGGSANLKVSYIGEEGFLNFRGDVAQYPGSVFVSLEDFQGNTIYPSKAYIDFIDDTNFSYSEFNLPANMVLVNMKENFMNSTTNVILGYIVFAFNSFSLLAGIILIIVFGNTFVNEQEKNIGILRIFGLKRNRLLNIFIIQVFLYFGLASVIGCLLGTQIGKLLLNSFSGIASGIMFESLGSFTSIPYVVNARTIIIGLLIGILIPFFIFLRKAIIITKNPPIESLRKDVEEYVPVSGTTFVAIILLIAGVITLIFGKSFALLGIILISLGCTFLFKNPFLNIIISLTLMLFSKTLFSLSSNPLSFNFIFQRAVLFAVISILFFTSIIPILKKLTKLFVSKNSLPILLGFSYIERFPIKILMLSLMFGIVIFGLIVIASIPSNLVKFVDSITEEGLFGYNYVVVSNPFKNLFASQDIEVYDGIQNPSTVQAALLDSELIVFVDDTFLESAAIPSESYTDWREQLKEKGTIMFGKFSDDENIPEEVEGSCTSFFPFGGNSQISYKVIGFFELKDIILPVKYVAHINNKPNNVKTVNLLMGKVDEQTASRLNELYMSNFYYPIFLEKELKIIFAGVDNIVNLATNMLYIGLISGFSGLALYSVRSYIIRKRIIGTLRAIGSHSNDIIIGFLIENFSIVSIGSLIGLFGGYLVARDIIFAIFQFLGTVDFYFPAMQIGSIILSVFLMSFLTLLFPSFLVSKISPAESMKEIE